jgi:hypothetical protein
MAMVARGSRRRPPGTSALLVPDNVILEPLPAASLRRIEINLPRAG